MENKRETELNKAEEFKAAYLKYQKLILKVAYDHIGDYHAAQDICQEAFLRLHHYFDSMPENKVKAWLIVVVTNLAKDSKRKGGKYAELVGLPKVEEDDPASFSYDIEYCLEQLVTQEFIAEAFARLRKKNIMWYDMLVLVECMEIPRKKIAEEYGIAVTTVDGYLKRAKEWMKKHYGDVYRSL